MNARYLTDSFFDALPIRRRRSTDWILPSALGVGFGVAAGVGIGLLLAPRAGVETRERLRAQTENFRLKARDFADRAKGQIASTGQQIGEALPQRLSSEIGR